MSEELVSNRKAFHEYEILDTYEAGIILLGTEIKSLRNHGGSLQDAFVDTKKEGLWLHNAYIAPYAFTSTFPHEERRPKKLLLHKGEIAKLKKNVAEKGLTIVPLSLYLTKKGLVKVKIALVKGKKLHDKRAALQKKEQQRALQRKEYE